MNAVEPLLYADHEVPLAASWPATLRAYEEQFDIAPVEEPEHYYTLSVEDRYRSTVRDFGMYQWKYVGKGSLQEAMFNMVADVNTGNWDHPCNW